MLFSRGNSIIEIRDVALTLVACSVWLHAVVARKSGTNLLSREDWRRAIIIVSRRARFESGLSESGRLSGLPLVHRVYFIVHAGESHAKPLMFSKTLSTMDDGRKSRGWAARVSARGGVIETSAASGTPCLLTSLFFYHLELGGEKFLRLWAGPALALVHCSSLFCRFILFLVSVFFPPGSPSNFTPFDLSNSRNCYSVTDQLPVARRCRDKHIKIFHDDQDHIALPFHK